MKRSEEKLYDIEYDYGFTMMIPKFKKLYEKGGIKYEDLNIDEQKGYLLELIEKNKNEKKYEIYYEEHENKNMHCHGIIFDISEKEMEKMRIIVCKNMGVKSQKQIEYVFDYKKIYKYDSWKKYCLKDQIKDMEKEDMEKEDMEKEDKYEIPKLEKKIGSEGDWKQKKRCVICKSEKYNPKWNNGYNAICKICYKEGMINKKNEFYQFNGYKFLN